MLFRLLAGETDLVVVVHRRDTLMKVLVVYESIFGNTRDIAQAIAQGLGSLADTEVELTEVGSAPASADGFDLVVVGGPVHAWHMTSPSTRPGARDQAREAGLGPVSTGIGVREWLHAMAPAVASQSAAAFDTAVTSRWFPVGSAAKGEAALLEHSGYRLVAEPEHFRVEGTDGPLIPGELERAREWGAALATA